MHVPKNLSEMHVKPYFNVFLQTLNRRPYIKDHLSNLIEFIKEKAPSSLMPQFKKLEKKVDGRGNPNFRKEEMPPDTLTKIIREANRCLSEEFEIYRGQNNETFLSSTLAIQLQEEFAVPQSTIRDNFQKKCKKVAGLFRLKDAYK